MPGHDVDPLSAQLGDDRLDPRALDADAGTDRVHGLVSRRDRDLGAAARLTDDLLDVDQPLVDLGYLEREQRGDEERVRAREDQPWASRRLLQLLEHGANRLALTEALAWVLLPPRDDRLGLAGPVEKDDQRATLDRLDLAGDQLADPVVELLANLVSLTLTNSLDDALLGSHHRPTTEIPEVHRDLHQITDLEVGIVPSCLLEQDLSRGILDDLDDLFQDDDPYVAIGLHLDLCIDRPIEASGERGVDSVTDEIVQLLL